MVSSLNALFLSDLHRLAHMAVKLQGNMINLATVNAELQLPSATVQLLQKDAQELCEGIFRPDNVYWLELALTPRGPDARARYADIWGAHRYTRVGPVLMMMPEHIVQFELQTWPQTSLVCQLHADAVRNRCQMDFEWTDRQLEACLNIPNPVIHDLLRRLAHELRHPAASSEMLAEALVIQLSIEVGRFCASLGKSRDVGGLSPWRLQIIDKRLAGIGSPPSLQELASLCNISIRQLTRGFRISRGSSIGDYLAQTRIEIAKRQLAEGRPIKSLAREMGFSSSSSFTQLFYRVTGLTPTQFRGRSMVSTRDSRSNSLR